MAFENVPWALNGAPTSAEVARMLVYGIFMGETGIALPTDLQVRALAVPGTQVRIGPGGASIASNYAGAAGQAYFVRNPTDTPVDVPATGSSGGATRYVIVRIEDPQYAGQEPPAGDYVRPEVVPSITGLQYPAIVLAKINQPASTATITQDMIEDLRQVAVPWERTVQRPKAIVAAGTEQLKATGADGEWFPNGGGEQDIYIPKWASRMQIRGEWFSIRYAPGNAYGRHWVEYGPYLRPSTRQYSTQQFSWDTANAPNPYRTDWTCVDDVAVPKELRGTTQKFVLKARQTGGTNGLASVDAFSGCNLEVKFMAVPDPSDS